MESMKIQDPDDFIIKDCDYDHNLKKDDDALTLNQDKLTKLGKTWCQ